MTDNAATSEMPEIPRKSYRSGSAKPVAEEPTVEDDDRTRQVISGTAVKQKPSLGSKVRDAFAGDDARSIGNYIFFDVVIPAAKAMLTDAISQGAERMFYGTSSPRTQRGYGAGSNRPSLTSNGGRRSSYRTESTSSRELSSQDRSAHRFDSIVLDDRGEAEIVLDRLSELISRYGSCKVADLYSAVGISPDFTDQKWGWKDLSTAGFRRVRNGVLLVLPSPEPLE